MLNFRVCLVPLNFTCSSTTVPVTGELRKKRTLVTGSATDLCDSSASTVGSSSAASDRAPSADRFFGAGRSASGVLVAGQQQNPLGFGYDRQSVHSDLEGALMQDGATPASPKAFSRAACC